jgi:hypothetical protein
LDRGYFGRRTLWQTEGRRYIGAERRNPEIWQLIQQCQLLDCHAKKKSHLDVIVPIRELKKVRLVAFEKNNPRKLSVAQSSFFLLIDGRAWVLEPKQPLFDSILFHLCDNNCPVLQNRSID